MVYMDIIGLYDLFWYNNWYVLVMVEDFIKINNIVCLLGKIEFLKYVKEFVVCFEC